MRMYKPKSRILKRCLCNPKCNDQCLAELANTVEKPSKVQAETTNPNTYVIIEETKPVEVDSKVVAVINLAATNAILVNEAVKHAQTIKNLLPTITAASEKVKKLQSEYTVNHQGKIVINAPLDMKNQSIHNIKNPENEGDAVNKLYLHTALDRPLDGKQKIITNVANPEADTDAVNKRYVDSRKKRHYIYSHAFVEGVNTKYFNPCICLEKCVIKYVQWNVLGGIEGNLFIHTKLLNGIGNFEKRELGKKVKNADMYEFALNIQIDQKTQITFSTDFATESSNVVVCYEN